MPANRASGRGAPPPVMTWRKAAPVLAIAAVFDALRFLFEWFVFFGPALAGVGCTYLTGGTVATGILCGAAATGGGVAAAPALEAFGIVMAMATGLLGWLSIALILLKGNARIFRENFIWFAGSLLGSEVPILGSVPFMTLILWKMYRTQIRKERAELKLYEAAEAVRAKREREYLLAAEQAQAATDAAYATAATDGPDEIPDDGRNAA